MVFWLVYRVLAQTFLGTVRVYYGSTFLAEGETPALALERRRLQHSGEVGEGMGAAFLRCCEPASLRCFQEGPLHETRESARAAELWLVLEAFRPCMPYDTSSARGGPFSTKTLTKRQAAEVRRLLAGESVHAHHTALAYRHVWELCFLCGGDGHYAAACTGAEAREAREELRHNPSEFGHLAPEKSGIQWDRASLHWRYDRKPIRSTDRVRSLVARVEEKPGGTLPFVVKFQGKEVSRHKSRKNAAECALEALLEGLVDGRSVRAWAKRNPRAPYQWRPRPAGADDGEVPAGPDQGGEAAAQVQEPA